MDSLLDQIRPVAKDRALVHRYRLSVRGDIERIKDALGSERWPPGTIAIFSCSGRDLYEEIPLPRRAREQVMVDATPLARPMLAVLGEYSRACVLVVNWEVAPVWEMYQDEMRELETVREPLRKGGNTGSRVLELAAVGGLAALGPQDCLWAGSMSAIDTLPVRDGTTLPGVV